MMKMFIFKKKNYLNREEFINTINSDKIWSKSMSIKEAKEFLICLESKILNYDFDEDKNFIMNSRRKYLKSIIENRLLENRQDTTEQVLDSMFNFWELVGDEYFGDFLVISEELGLSVQELTKMDDEYRRKNIICAQERDVILEIIQFIKKYIDEVEN